MSKAKKNKKAKALGGGRLNPPFDPRMLSIGVPGHTKRFKRGWLIAANDVTGDPDRGGGRINFLYNPTGIEVSHSVLWSISNASDFSGNSINQQIESLNGINIGSTGVELLFDRTYEVWDRSKRNTLAGRFGCYADVLAFYQFFGITGMETEIGDVVQEGDIYNQRTQTMWQSLYPSEFMAPTQLHLYIGEKIRFYGYATDLAVRYTHFNYEMVPVRCKVAMTIALLSDDVGNPHVKKTKVKRGENKVPVKTGQTRPGDQE